MERVQLDRTKLPSFVTVPEAARRLGLGLRQLRRAIRDGELQPVVTHETSWPRLSLEDVRRWAESLKPARPKPSPTLKH